MEIPYNSQKQTCVCVLFIVYTFIIWVIPSKINQISETSLAQISDFANIFSSEDKRWQHL